MQKETEVAIEVPDQIQEDADRRPVKNASKYWRSYCLFDANVCNVSNGGYYSLVSENAQDEKVSERISTLSLSRTTIGHNLSFWPSTGRSKNSNWLSVKEVANLN